MRQYFILATVHERRDLGVLFDFTVAATVDFTNMLDYANLHWHDFKLLADFLANGVFAAAADTRQLMLGKSVDDSNAWQFGGQRLAFTATLGSLAPYPKRAETY